MDDHHDGDLTLTETEASYQAELVRLREEIAFHLNEHRVDAEGWARSRRFQSDKLAHAEAERDALTARLAAAEKVVEAAQAVLDAERHTWTDDREAVLDSTYEAMGAAVDAYRTHEPEPEQT